MILKTKRLILRPWKESDAEDLFEFAKNPKIGPIAGWPPHKNVDESLAVIRNVFSDNLTFATCLKEENRAVGSIDLKMGEKTDLTNAKDEAEIGYWIGAKYWGQGLIPEGAKEIIRYGFEDLHLKCLWAGYYDGNEKSHRVQEKCGFKYHHTTKDVYVPRMNETRIGHVSFFDKRAVGTHTRKIKTNFIFMIIIDSLENILN